MKDIENKLSLLEGYLLSIKRNTINGWYELEIGLPKNWIYKSNKIVKCDTIKKTEAGNLIKISPIKNNVYIDDLISFVELIIETNSKIAEKEKQFTSQMDQVKKDLENKAKEFYKELDELREKSFDKFNSETKKNTTNPTANTTTKKSKGRPKGSKNKPKVDNNEEKEV